MCICNLPTHGVKNGLQKTHGEVRKRVIAETSRYFRKSRDLGRTIDHDGRVQEVGLSETARGNVKIASFGTQIVPFPLVLEETVGVVRCPACFSWLLFRFFPDRGPALVAILGDLPHPGVESASLEFPMVEGRFFTTAHCCLQRYFMFNIDRLDFYCF